MRFFKILVFGLILSEVHQVRAATVQINANGDADQYIYRLTYTDTSSYMNVGQYAGGFSRHYYVGLANWNYADLNPLAGQSNVALSLYVQNFVDPVFGIGGPNSQPERFTYPPTGNFTLKVVALSGTPNPTGMDDAWVKTNMIEATEIASVTLTSSGYSTVNIGNIVANWINAGTGGPLWLGFVGTGSTTSIYTSVHLGTLEPTELSPANPMYLSVETSPPAPVVRSCSISENNLVMIFETVHNISYTLKTKSNLSDPAWVTVDPSFLAGPTPTTTLRVPMTDSPRQGFYRLEITP